MTVKGIDGWTDYLVEQLSLQKEEQLYSTKYTLPVEVGKGYMECLADKELWNVWLSDFELYRELHGEYAQSDPYYLAFTYRELKNMEVDHHMTYPSDAAITFDTVYGTAMKAVGIYYFTPYFEKLTKVDIIDFVTTMQSYDESILVKQITPLLRPILSYQGPPLARRLFVESRVLELAALLITIVEEEQKPTKVVLSAFDTSQLHEVLKILEENLSSPPSIQALARKVAINEYKLKAGFRQLFGTTIYEYLRLLRMEKAADLLQNSNLSIAEIGQLVGYQTPHGFASTFKRYYGTTPLKWKNSK